MTILAFALFPIVAGLQGYAVGYGYMGLDRSAAWARAKGHAAGGLIIATLILLFRSIQS